MFVPAGGDNRAVEKTQRPTCQACFGVVSARLGLAPRGGHWVAGPGDISGQSGYARTVTMVAGFQVAPRIPVPAASCPWILFQSGKSPWPPSTLAPAFQPGWKTSSFFFSLPLPLAELYQ